MSKEGEMTEKLDLRSAVERAFEAIQQELYPDRELPDLLLEEVMLRPNEWEVTPGFTNPHVPQSAGALSGLMGQPKPRIYKRVLIDAKTGAVKGMLDGRIDEE